MTDQEIMQLAKEAGMTGLSLVDLGFLERFATIVADREREACARVCDDESAEWDIWRDGWHAANECAAAIRSRNDKENQQ